MDLYTPPSMPPCIYKRWGSQCNQSATPTHLGLSCNTTVVFSHVRNLSKKFRQMAGSHSPCCICRTCELYNTIVYSPITNVSRRVCVPLAMSDHIWARSDMARQTRGMFAVRRYDVLHGSVIISHVVPIVTPLN